MLQWSAVNKHAGALHVGKAPRASAAALILQHIQIGSTEALCTCNQAPSPGTSLPQ